MTFIRRWDEFPVVEEIPKVKRRAICGDQVMMARVEYEEGAVVGKHRHPAEQILYVLEGRIRVKIGDEESDMGPGNIAVIPSGAYHATRALEAAVFVEAFHPIRQSYLIGYCGPSDAEFKSD